jgi:hypothetical protein
MTANGKKRSNSIISHQVGEGSVKFVVDQIGETELVFDKLSPEIKQQAMIHGLIQRIRDAAAISRELDKDGKELSATPEAKFSAMKELVEWYSSGTDQWAMNRTGGGGSGGERGLLVRVLKRAGAKLEDVDAWVKAKSMAEVKTLLNSSKLKPLADELRLEGAAKVDADEMLRELDI